MEKATQFINTVLEPQFTIITSIKMLANGLIKSSAMVPALVLVKIK